MSLLQVARDAREYGAVLRAEYSEYTGNANTQEDTRQYHNSNNDQRAIGRLFGRRRGHFFRHGLVSPVVLR